MVNTFLQSFAIRILNEEPNIFVIWPMYDYRVSVEDKSLDVELQGQRACALVILIDVTNLGW